MLSELRRVTRLSRRHPSTLRGEPTLPRPLGRRRSAESGAGDRSGQRGVPGHLLIRRSKGWLNERLLRVMML